MGNENQYNNGYEDDESGDDYKEQILELCKLAQGNITTIYWCKQQIRKRLKVLDRYVNRMSDVNKLDETPDKHAKKKRLEELIKGQTDGCKDLGTKIQEEIESLEQIRISAKSFGIDIKTRLLELDDTLDNDDVDSLLGDSE
jgi:t-SNARE complex subunit (syntaxin)